MRTAFGAGSSSLIGIVEEDHHAVAGEALERALVREDQRAHRRVVFASTLMTSSGSAVSVKAVKPRRSRNTTVISRRWVFSGSSPPPVTIDSASCGREEALQPAQALELRDLLLHALLERSVPLGELRRLRCTLSYSALMRSSERTRASSSGWLIGLDEEVVGAGLDALDALLRRDRAR